MRPAPVGPPLEVNSIRARAVLTIEDGESSLKGRAEVMARRPAFFRIEVPGPFGQRLLLLSSDGKALTLFSEGRLRTYPLDDLPFSFTAEELVSLLLGVIPGGSEASQPGFISAIVSRDGLSYRVELSDFKPADGGTLPFSISIEDGTRRMSVRYLDVSVNPVLGEEVFTVDSR